MDKESIVKGLQSTNREIKDEDFSILEGDKIKVGCKSCGKCCRNRTDILLRPSDIHELAKGLNMSQLDFILKYCNRYVGDSSNIPILSIKFRDQGNNNNICPFLKKVDNETYHCRVHGFKPSVCKIYPLGRISDNNKKEITYIMQNISCVSEEDKTEMLIGDWIGHDIDKQDKYFFDYYEKVWYLSKKFNLKKLWKVAEQRGFTDSIFATLIALLYVTDSNLPLEEAMEKYGDNKEIDELATILKKSGISVSR